jgi:uncharacterized membrane protein YfcA
MAIAMVMPHFWEYALITLAALAAGAINALAGGGTLLTFPVLTAVGIPAVAANMTNTVALCPGYLGGILAQRKDLQGQTGRLWLFIPAGVIGGLLGALLLRVTNEGVFRELVPYLILAGVVLLALQERVRNWLTRRAQAGGSVAVSERWGMIPVGLAAVYGGYFGAGLSVIVLAVLGLIIDDSLTRINAVKQVISFGANVAAAAFFVFSRQVVWPVALVMFLGALLGGVLGGKLAGRVKPAVLRRIVVVIGAVAAVFYLVR